MARGYKTGGRLKGTPNKITSEIRAVMIPHAKAALTELVRLAGEAQSEATRLAAIREIFDRAYGKARPAAPVEEEDNTAAIMAEARATLAAKIDRIIKARGDSRTETKRDEPRGEGTER